jgi:predicted CoA-binding protein
MTYEVAQLTNAGKENMVSSDDDLKSLLRSAKVIAVVGASRDESKDSHTVPAYLQEQGYR